MTDISNLDAERSVIGSLINDIRVQDQTMRLTSEDFTQREYRLAFAEIQRLRAEKKPIDLMTVTDKMDGTVTSIIISAIQQTPVTFNCASYVDLVLDASMRRRAATVAETLYRAMVDRQSDAQGELATARSKLADLGLTGASDWVSATDIAMRTLDELERRSRGELKPIQSGIPDLDYITGGFFPGELTIIGAKPGVGKSVFGMMVAIHAAQTGFHSGVCSLEMMDTQYGQRLLSNLSGVDGMKLRKAEGIDAEDWKLLTEAALILSRTPTAFMFQTRFVEDLVLAVRNKIDRDGLDILVVDYLQLVRTRQRTESERLSVAMVSWALKCLAVECRIPVIALAQLRRPEQAAASKMPTMRDLRESGNLEADADNIILLHEPDGPDDQYVYKDDKAAFDQLRKDGNRYIALKIEKQRQGSTGVVSVLFKPSRMKYLQIERRK